MKIAGNIAKPSLETPEVAISKTGRRRHGEDRRPKWSRSRSPKAPLKAGPFYCPEKKEVNPMSRNVPFLKTSGSKKVSIKQEKCIAALLEQPTQKAAAAACGITVRTIQRYLNEPEFAAAYRQAKNELFSRTTQALRRTGNRAVRTLYEIATNEKTPPGAPARVAAARALLEFGISYVEIEDILVRLEKLEAERGNDDE
jgi:hypothetical protein